jgi:hypothetical protein
LKYLEPSFWIAMKYDQTPNKEDIDKSKYELLTIIIIVGWNAVATGPFRLAREY